MSASPATGSRATVSIGDVTIGPFTGELRFTLYRERAWCTSRPSCTRRKIVVQSSMTQVCALAAASKTRFAWVDTEGKLRREAIAHESSDRHLAVRHRALIAETDSGSVACFPPPHQFFFPRDLTENLSTVWFGRDHRGLDVAFRLWHPSVRAPEGVRGSPGSTPRPAPTSAWESFISSRPVTPRKRIE